MLFQVGTTDRCRTRMTHVKRFREIPMSKSMRGLCKEEDYAFLGMSEARTKGMAKGAGVSEDVRMDREEARVHGQEKWERQEQERLREEEESKEEKQPQLTSMPEKTVCGRLARLREFREFQRKVLVEECGMDGGTHAVNQLLTRM